MDKDGDIAAALAVFDHVRRAECRGEKVDYRQVLVQHSKLRHLLEPLLADAGDRDGDQLGVIGHFALLEELGRGTYGTVYRAIDRRHATPVALKVLHPGLTLPDQSQRFLRETRALLRLRHSNICSVLDHGEADGSLYLALELISGRTLEDVFSVWRREATPIEDRIAALVAWGIAGCAGLQHAHSHGVVHRDVKPSNLMVSNDGRLVVIDFGLARDDHDDRNLTSTGRLLGTPAYMAPEMLSSGRRVPVGPVVDVYGLGVVLYEGLTLSQPYGDANALETIAAIRSGRSVTPHRLCAGVPKALSRVVSQAIERDPVHRYSSADELARDLERFRRNERVRARRPSPARRLTSFVRHSPWVATSLAMLTLLTIVSVALAVAAIRVVRAESALGVLTALNCVDAAEDDVTRLPTRLDCAADLRAWLSRHADGLMAHRDRCRELLTRISAQPGSVDAKFPTLLRSLLDDLARAQADVWKLRDRRQRLRPAESDPTVAEVANNLEVAIQRLDADVRRLNGWILEHPAVDPVDYSHRVASKSLEALQHALGPRGNVELVRQRLAIAERVASVTDAQVWSKNQAWLDARPVYGGFRMPSQAGLLPLGPDPQSDLLEFAHLPTADAAWGAPRRGGTGCLELTPAHGVVLVLVPGGRHMIGLRSTGRHGAHSDGSLPSGCAQIVDLAPFLLGKYELTHAQWSRIHGSVTGGLSPLEYSTSSRDRRPRVFSWLHPATGMSWLEARRSLSRVGLTLPTEIQWEIACRAATTTATYFGRHDAISGLTNIADESAVQAGVIPTTVERARTDDGWPITAPVDALPANPWGFHEMLGNVQEFCSDMTSGLQVDAFQAPTQPNGVRRSTSRGHMAVIRGGHFGLPPSSVDCATRGAMLPTQTLDTVGVRVLCPLNDCQGVDVAVVSPSGADALGLRNDLSNFGYVELPGSRNIQPQRFTIELWVEPSGPGFGHTWDAGGASLITCHPKSEEDEGGVVAKSVAGPTITWVPATRRVLVIVSSNRREPPVWPEDLQGVDVKARRAIALESRTLVDLHRATHVAVTYDGCSLRLFVDGRIEQEASYESGVSYDRASDWRIGAQENVESVHRRFEGIIDEVRIWDHARTPDAIAANLGRRLTGRESGLLGLWTFDKGSLRDGSTSGFHGKAIGDVAFAREPRRP